MALLSASSSTPSSSSSSSHHWKYDAFLSFRGEDTRRNFTDHLLRALLRAGIRTFFDENDLETGEPIGPDLLKAIEESMCWIIVFSKGYAFSTWCLDELVHIMECKKTSNRKVVPIFYDVEPSDVRKQEKSFEEAFAKHQVRFKHESDKLKRWRDALTEATNLKGVDARNRPESSIVEDIVTDILNKVIGKKLSLPVNPVGLDYRAQKVISLLEKVDVCIVGICGMGGIGKTTIAREVYNIICQQFDGRSCFLANVREASDSPSILCLQKQLLSEVLKRRDESIYNVYQGVQAIENLLHRLRVLVVLDDVDDPQQLYNIIGNHQQFCPGSKIIITTRKKDLLKPLEVYRQYWVPELNSVESLELLSMKAFGRSQPPEEYMECSNMLIHYCSGIPLALEVLGSLLSRKKSVGAWKDKLKELEEIMDVKIQNVLEISYRSLSEREQRVFLDIACFFIGKDQYYVISILDGCNFYPTNAIDTLIHAGLLNIEYDHKLEMHDLIWDMARDIVRRECDKDPGMRSRVWRKEDALDLLRDEMGTKTVEGLSLNLQPGSSKLLNTTAFKEMKNLRLLQLDYIGLEGAYKYISKRLRWLRWHGFPLECIPVDLHLGNVVVLDMRYSSLRQFQKPMEMEKVKIFNLSHSCQLTQTPNFKGFPSLEIMKLKGCISLVEVDESILLAAKLVTLNLKDCINLEYLPKSFFEVSLDKLNASGCSKLFSHSSLSRLVPVSIKELDISFCNLVDDMIPDDIQRLPYLKVLNMRGNNFSRLPAGISHLPQLQYLYFSDCQCLESVMELPSSLMHFEADRCTKFNRLNLFRLQADRCYRASLSSAYKIFERRYFSIRDCPVLVEVDGYFKVEPIDDEMVKKLETHGLPLQLHMAKVRLRILIHLTRTTTTIRFLPAVSWDGVYSIYIPGNEIPNWYSHQNEGNSVSFTVPRLDNSDITGFIFFAVYAWNDNYARDEWWPWSHWHKFSKVLFKNKSKKVEYQYRSKISCIPEEAEQYITWHGFWRFDKFFASENIYATFNETKRRRFMNETEGGDQVKVEIKLKSGLVMKKCGVGLLYQQNNTEDSQINTSLFLQNLSSKCGDYLNSISHWIIINDYNQKVDLIGLYLQNKFKIFTLTNGYEVVNGLRDTHARTQAQRCGKLEVTQFGTNRFEKP